MASPRRGKAGAPRQTTKRPTAKTGTPKATSRDTKHKSSAAASRPKSAPKFRGQKQKRVTLDDDDGGSSEVPEVDEYSSVQDESSEEDIPLPEEEEEVEEELGESEASEVSEDESLRDGHRNNKVR